MQATPLPSDPRIPDGRTVEEANRLRTIVRVLSNTAHDINNVLQIISGSAELLAMKATIGEPERQRIQRVSVQTLRAADLLERLSAYARPGESGRQTVDLGGVVDLALGFREFSFRRARLEVELHRADPPALMISGDRRRLVQLLLNLFLNAEQALAGRSDPKLRIAMARRPGAAVLIVADNGPGLSPALRAAALDRDTVPGLTSELGGVGLWVVGRIASDHGGCLELDEADGGGLRVTLTLPLAG
jgi:two-component system C4-dicarboxylate transport sensor histidine kinase DctB